MVGRISAQHWQLPWGDGWRWLDTFKLGYELVRDEISMHRDHLERHGGRDDNVVIVKTAHGG
jgi:hypothetical protein